MVFFYAPKVEVWRTTGRVGPWESSLAVDFSLKDREDPDPAKAEQYVRWRELRNQQEQNEAKRRAAPANWHATDQGVFLERPDLCQPPEK